MGGDSFERIGEVGGVKERTGGRAVSLLLCRLLPVENVESEESLDVGTGVRYGADQVTDQLQAGHWAGVTAGVAGAAQLPGEGGQGGRGGQSFTQYRRTGMFAN